MRNQSIIYVAQCQTLLEVMDELKNTPLYKHKIKSLVKNLECELEKFLKGDISYGFTKDSEHFNVLMNGIESISKWIAKTQDFNDIMRLADNLNAGGKIESIEETKKTAIKSLGRKLRSDEITLEKFNEIINTL
tara:strand:- start:160 stop:561 length:402 start_codon:yes stop_codon:yes gene_type:complete